MKIQEILKNITIVKHLKENTDKLHFSQDILEVNIKENIVSNYFIQYAIDNGLKVYSDNKPSFTLLSEDEYLLSDVIFNFASDKLNFTIICEDDGKAYINISQFDLFNKFIIDFHNFNKRKFTNNTIKVLGESFGLSSRFYRERSNADAIDLAVFGIRGCRFWGTVNKWDPTGSRRRRIASRHL